MTAHSSNIETDEDTTGISQRDPNYYDFWNETDTQQKVLAAVTSFWETHIKGKWDQTQGDCKPHPTFNTRTRFIRTDLSPPLPDVFDFLLTRDLSRGHIIDFNPYHPRTDPLLFTYDELHTRLLARADRPELRVVNSPSHPAATRNAPAHQHNMVPIEALAMSSGRDVMQFADVWQDEIRKSMAEEGGEEEAS